MKEFKLFLSLTIAMLIVIVPVIVLSLLIASDQNVYK